MQAETEGNDTNRHPIIRQDRVNAVVWAFSAML